MIIMRLDTRFVLNAYFMIIASFEREFLLLLLLSMIHLHVHSTLIILFCFQFQTLTLFLNPAAKNDDYSTQSHKNIKSLNLHFFAVILLLHLSAVLNFLKKQNTLATGFYHYH